MSVRWTWKTDHGDTVTVFPDGRKAYSWHVRAGNGEVVGQGESHPNASDAIAAAERHHPPVASDG